MERANLALALLLVLNIAAVTWRLGRGPTPADRMQAALVVGTTGVAALLTLAQAMSAPALRDVALALAVLAAIVTVVLLRRDGAPRERR